MDFSEYLSFRKFVTPLAIQVIFWIGAIGVVISGLFQMRSVVGFVSGIVTIVVGVVLVRIYCELLILLFRIYDELVMLRTGRSNGGGPGFEVLPTKDALAEPAYPNPAM